MVKKNYVSPVLQARGRIEDLTRGSRFAFEDAWFGVAGADGIIGPKCGPGDDATTWWQACGS